MHARAPAILLSARQSGEAGVLARFFTQEFGLVAAYVAGGRGRNLRPVLIPGNLVDLQLTMRPGTQLPFARPELTRSRAPFIGEPLAAAAITWACALTAAALPERQAYPALFSALGGVLDAVASAPAARDWAGALAGYETLLLRDLGYGGEGVRPTGSLAEVIAALDALGPAIDHYLLAGNRADVMAARHRLRELLGRIE
jgi:DNA repair protein RecO (recombination protein O)